MSEGGSRRSPSRRRRSDEGSTTGSGHEETAIAAVVLGMHRSGTSALARLISLLGADLPRNLLPANPTNPAGHWEPQHVADLNDEVLASAGSTWDDVEAFPATWHGSTSEAGFRARAVEVLESEYGESPLFVLKDPRICRLLPFWLGVLGDFGAQATFAVIVRNPLEVASSLRARDGFPVAKGLLMWLRHTLDAERDTRGHPRVFVSYEALLRDWEAQARVISEGLELSWPKLNSRTRAEIDNFLSPSLRHAEFTTDELVAQRSVVDWAKTAYLVLERAAQQGTTPDSDALDEVRTALDQAEIAYGPLLAHLELEQRELAESMVTEEELDALRAGHAEYEQANSALTEQLASQINDHESLRREIEALREGHAEYEEAHGRLTRNLSAREETLEAQNAELESLRAQNAELESLISEHDAYRQAQDTELDRLASELELASANAATDAANDRARFEEVARERDVLAVENQAIGERLEEHDDRLRTRDDEVKLLRAELSRRLEEARETIGARDRDLDELSASLRSSESQYSNLSARLRHEAHRFADANRQLEDRLAELQAQSRFIREQDARLHDLEGMVTEARDAPLSRGRRFAIRLRSLFSHGQP